MGQPEEVKRLIDEVRRICGPIAVLHWNAYVLGAANPLEANLGDLRRIFDVSVNGSLSAVQAALADLKHQRRAVVVTGGGLAFYGSKTYAYSLSTGTAGLAIGKASQHKTVGLLREAVSSEGVFVGDVVVASIVKATAFDRGNGKLSALTIAERFWNRVELRKEAEVTLVSA